MISAMVSGLQIYATEKLIDSGRRYYPANPFDALAKKLLSYDGNDDSDDEWTFNSSTNRITHMRKDGSKYYWNYDAGTNTEIIIPNTDCWSGDFTNHEELMAAVDNGFIQATRSANSESQCGDGETFFWCQQPGSSTDNYDYCGNNGDCPVNGVNGSLNSSSSSTCLGLEKCPRIAGICASSPSKKKPNTTSPCCS